MSGVLRHLLSYVYSALRRYAGYAPVVIAAGGRPPSMQQLESSVAVMGSRDRDSLVHEIASQLDGDGELDRALAELDATLDECRVALAVYERKERFVGLRLERYTELMGRRGRRIDVMSSQQQKQQRQAAGGDDDDDAYAANEDLEDNARQHVKEELDSLDALRSKHAADEEKLRRVRGVHKNLITQIEMLRRRVLILEGKRSNALARKEECREFLIAAADMS